jgi:hypothetical protein
MVLKFLLLSTIVESFLIRDGSIDNILPSSFWVKRLPGLAYLHLIESPGQGAQMIHSGYLVPSISDLSWWL